MQANIYWSDVFTCCWRWSLSIAALATWNVAPATTTTMTIRSIDVEIDLQNISHRQRDQETGDDASQVRTGTSSSRLDRSPSPLDRWEIKVVAQEIVGVAASSGRARQVFWWRRDARRPSYSGYPHLAVRTTSSLCPGCSRNPRAFIIITRYDAL